MRKSSKIAKLRGSTCPVCKKAGHAIDYSGTGGWYCNFCNQQYPAGKTMAQLRKIRLKGAIKFREYCFREARFRLANPKSTNEYQEALILVSQQYELSATVTALRNIEDESPGNQVVFLEHYLKERRKHLDKIEKTARIEK